MAYRRSYSSSLGYWLSNSWDEALFFAVGGALIASAVVYVLMVALRRS